MEIWGLHNEQDWVISKGTSLVTWKSGLYAYNSYSCFSLSACTCCLMGNSLWSLDKGREGPFYRSVKCVYISQKYTAIPQQPLSGTSMKDSDLGQSFETCTWFTLLGRGNGQICGYILIHGLVATVWLLARDLQRTWLENW